MDRNMTVPEIFSLVAEVLSTGGPWEEEDRAAQANISRVQKDGPVRAKKVVRFQIPRKAEAARHREHPAARRIRLRQAGRVSAEQ